jgi:hypothetical protein
MQRRLGDSGAEDCRKWAFAPVQNGDFSPVRLAEL